VRRLLGSCRTPQVLAIRETKDDSPAAPPPLQGTLGSAASIGPVEIVLGNGRVLRVAERIDPAVLARPVSRSPIIGLRRTITSEYRGAGIRLPSDGFA
jgi:hypothetical protein